MMPAGRHLDPVLGVDIHIVQTPAGPMPIPHPSVEFVFDVMDYIPIIGATVKAGGLPRAQAGTGARALFPHIPIGGTFLKPPANEGETFMGSQTVVVESEPFTHMALPSLSCQEFGFPSLPRKKPKTKPKSLLLPLSVVLSIPMAAPVLVGGPPTITMPWEDIALFLLSKLGKGLKKLRKRQKRGRRMKALSDRIHRKADKLCDKLKLGDRSRNRVHRATCTVTGHPVDVATGKLFTDATDIELPGPLPFEFERVWYSTDCDVPSPLGLGWHHDYDVGLLETETDVIVRLADGRGVAFPKLRAGRELYNRKEKLTLRRDERRYTLRTAEGLTYRFAPVRAQETPVPIESVEDRSGNRISLFYSEQGRLAGIVDSGGHELTVKSDARGLITEIWGPHPEREEERQLLAAYEYDAEGHLIETRNALGYAMRFEYRDHLLVREINRIGLSFYFVYDKPGRDAKCVHTWGDGGIYNHKLEYRAGLTIVENSLGHKTWYYHNGVTVHKTVDALGNTTRSERNEYEELEREADALGNSTSYVYDERGNPTQITAPDGAKLRLEYAGEDQLIAAEDAIGGKWAWRYDEQGRLIARTDPLEQTVEFVWSGRLLRAFQDAVGGETRFSYDLTGNLAGLRTPDGAERRWEYDRLGRCTRAIDPKGNVQRREQDALGRVVRVFEPDGNVRELEYDGEDNVLRARDRQHDVRFEYQGMWRLSARSEAGTTVRFEYDTEEQLTGVINEHGYVYRFVLGPTGEVEQEIGFDGVTRTYQRDRAGRVVRVDRPGGLFTQYGHDSAGRVVEAKHSDGTREWYVYRKDGELMQCGNTTTHLRFERDVLGRVLKEIQAEHWVESQYDALGLRREFRSSMGARVQIERNLMGDVLGLQASVGEEGTFSAPVSGIGTATGGGENSGEGGKNGTAPNGGGETLGNRFEARFQRDNLGLELERSLPGGVRSRWTRDKLGRPVTQEVFSGDQWKGQREYVWDVNDRLKMVVNAMKGPVRYTHDALGNLAAATYEDGRVELRMPDAVGNLFRTENRSDRKYGASGQLLEARGPLGVTRYEYDEEGNLARKIEPDGGAWRYEWNSAGMLSCVVRPDGHVVEFGYDLLGRRVWKKFRGKVTRWVWDGNVPLHEWVEFEPGTLPEVQAEALKDALVDTIRARQRAAELQPKSAMGPPSWGRGLRNGAEQGGVGSGERGERGAAWVQARSAQGDFARRVELGTREQPITWLFEPESFAPLGKLANGDHYGIVTDHLGTPVQMFDGMGREVWATDIGAYGDLRGLRGERAACPFRWPGQYEDAETGLYYNRFRYYDPDVGGYLSRDPIGLMGGLRLCGYVADPVGWVDIFGLNQSSPQGGCGSGNASGRSRRKFTGPEKTKGGYWVQVDLKTLKPIMKRKIPGLSGKEGAKDVPSWARQETPYAGESGNAFATRLCDEKYGEGNWPKGPGTEHNEIKKWGDRSFEDPE